MCARTRSSTSAAAFLKAAPTAAASPSLSRQLSVSAERHRQAAHDHLPRRRQAVEAVPVDAAALHVGWRVGRHEQRDRVRHRLDALELGERLLLLEVRAGERALVVADEGGGRAGHGVDVVEGLPHRTRTRLVRSHGPDALDAHVGALRIAGEVGEEAPRVVGDARAGKTRLGDEGAHLVRADPPHGDVGRGVVAVGDHGLQHDARRRRAGQVLEHGPAGRADLVVDGELLVEGQPARLHLPQVGREHERLEAAAAEQPGVGRVRDAPRLGAVADVDLRRLGAGQRHEAVEQSGDRPRGPLLRERRGRQHRRGSGRHRELRDPPPIQSLLLRVHAELLPAESSIDLSQPAPACLSFIPRRGLCIP